MNTLRPNTPVNFNVYLQLGQRYLHYIRVQDIFESDRLKRLRSKGVKKIFIPLDEENNYLNYLDQGLEALKEGDSSQKAVVAKSMMENLSENMEKSFDSAAGMKKAQEQIEKIVDLLTSDPNAVKSIMADSGLAIDQFQHCASVAGLCLGLAQKLKFTKKQINELVMAALIHDVGKQKLSLPPNLMMVHMKKEQLEEYKRHCHLAKEMLSGKKFITPSIIRLVSDHEEIGEGKGFPEKKNILSLPVNSQILNLCNDFDRSCMSSGEEPKVHIKKYFSERANLFVFDHVLKLRELILDKGGHK